MPEWRYTVSGIVVGTSDLKALAIPDEMAEKLFDLLDSPIPYVRFAEGDKAKSYCNLGAFAYLKVERRPAGDAASDFIRV